MNPLDYVLIIACGILGYWVGISIYFWRKEHHKHWDEFSDKKTA